MEGQAAQHARLSAANAENRARADSMRGALTPGMLLWAPLDGGWTIGWVYEHLVMTHESYHARLRALIERGAVARSAAADSTEVGLAAPVDFPWRPSFFGGWLSASMLKPGKLPAPGIYRPASQPRPDVVGLYLKSLDETSSLLAAAAGLEWQRLRLSSPVSPLLRMNLGDAFTILANHDTRHMRQIERVRGQAGFPRPR